jgi:hypothetical protein
LIVPHGIPPGTIIPVYVPLPPMGYPPPYPQIYQAYQQQNPPPH